MHLTQDKGGNDPALYGQGGGNWRRGKGAGIHCGMPSKMLGMKRHVPFSLQSVSW